MSILWLCLTSQAPLVSGVLPEVCSSKHNERKHSVFPNCSSIHRLFRSTVNIGCISNYNSCTSSDCGCCRSIPGRPYITDIAFVLRLDCRRHRPPRYLLEPALCSVDDCLYRHSGDGNYFQRLISMSAFNFAKPLPLLKSFTSGATFLFYKNLKIFFNFFSWKFAIIYIIWYN